MQWKETALHHTAIKNDVQGLELLIKHGADVNAITDGEYEGHEVKFHCISLLLNFAVEVVLLFSFFIPEQSVVFTITSRAFQYYYLIMKRQMSHVIHNRIPGIIGISGNIHW